MTSTIITVILISSGIGMSYGDKDVANHSPSPQKHKITNLMVNTDFGYNNPTLHLINTDTDQMFTVNLTEIDGFPEELDNSIPMHMLVSPKSPLLLMTLVSSDSSPSGIAVFKINSIDWENSKADIQYRDFLNTADAGTKSSILKPQEINTDERIAKWNVSNQQTHGPTLHPQKNLAYFTQWTDNKIWVIDTKTGDFAKISPIQDSTFTRQLHGVYFDPTGKTALGAPYYFDLNYLPLFKVDKKSGDLDINGIISLTVDEEGKRYGAFSHLVDWKNERYAFVGTMQTDETSLTPSGFTVELPSVFLIDAKKGIATQVIPPDTDSSEGILKPISDVLIVGDKLYVAEENTMTSDIADSSAFVSVWDITDISSPVFIKRFEAGVDGMPEEFHVAHTLYKTSDEKSVYVQNWYDGYLIKIDTQTDQIIKIFDKSDGLVNPHGAFIKGSLR